jgi:hypothetical protein
MQLDFQSFLINHAIASHSNGQKLLEIAARPIDFLVPGGNQLFLLIRAVLDPLRGIRPKTILAQRSQPAGPEGS